MKGKRKQKSKKIKLIKLSIISLFFLFLFGTSTYFIVRFIQGIIQQSSANKKVIVTFSSVYSDDLKKQIESFVKKEFNCCKDPSIFHGKLKKNFKIVKKTTLNKTSPGVAQLSIEGVEPFAIVNNRFVIGNKKRLFDPVFFASCDFNKLKKIFIKPCFLNEKMTSCVYEFMQKIPYSIWNIYTIRYEGDHKIILQDRGADVKRIVVVDKNSIFDEDKLSRLEAMQEDFLNRKKLSSRWLKKRSLVFDLRFKDRVYAATRYRDLLDNWEGVS
jgi:hypothetical protein